MRWREVGLEVEVEEGLEVEVEGGTSRGGGGGREV